MFLDDYVTFYEKNSHGSKWQIFSLNSNCAEKTTPLRYRPKCKDILSDKCHYTMPKMKCIQNLLNSIIGLSVDKSLDRTHIKVRK